MIKATNRVDALKTEIESDGFKRLFATLFVANNFNFPMTMDKMLADGRVSRPHLLRRAEVLSDSDTARYIREELVKRRDQWFFTAEDIAAGMYAIAANPENTPEQRFPYYKVLAEATGLIGRGKQTAQDVSPSAGVVIQIANYGSEGLLEDRRDVARMVDERKVSVGDDGRKKNADVRKKNADVRKKKDDIRKKYEDVRQKYEDVEQKYDDVEQKYDDVTKPRIEATKGGPAAIIPVKASGKRLTPSDAELDAMALSDDALSGVVE